MQKKTIASLFLLILLASCASPAFPPTATVAPTLTATLSPTETETSTPTPKATKTKTPSPTPKPIERLTIGQIDGKMSYDDFHPESPVPHDTVIKLNDTFLNDPALQVLSKNPNSIQAAQLLPYSDRVGKSVTLSGKIDRTSGNLWPHYAVYEEETGLYLIIWEVIIKDPSDPSGKTNMRTSITTAHNPSRNSNTRLAEIQVGNLSIGTTILNIVLKDPNLDSEEIASLLGDDPVRDQLLKGIISPEMTDMPFLMGKIQ